MGLSIVVSGAIVLFSLFFVMSAFPVIADNVFQVSQSSSEIAYVEIQILRTKIDITSISASPGDQNISVMLDNVGIKKLWEYDKFDFIVTYDAEIDGNKVRTTEKLAFVDSCPTNIGEWCLQDITNDISDVGILNSGESATLTADLQNNVHSTGGVVIVTISTENGQSVTDSVVV